MITSNNIYRIDFVESYGGVQIPRSVIFNITQISEEYVRDLIMSGCWNEDVRLIEVQPLQWKYLQDKEEK